MVSNKSKIVVAIMIIGMLISGTTNTVATKFQNLTCSNTSDGRYIKYTHPWVQTLVMFGGEFSCLGMLLIKRRFFPENESDDQEVRSLLGSPQDSMGETTPLVNGSASESPGTTSKNDDRIFSWIFALPAGLDLFGTTIASVALLFIPSSVWQLLRGSLIVFVGIFSVIFLKRRLKVYNWVGMAIVVAGLTLVGISVLLKPDDSGGSGDGPSSAEMVLGVVLVLVGQLISSIQFIVEETFLSKRKCDPLQVVGMEGFFGLCFTAIVLIPWYHVPENPVLPECDAVNVTAPGPPTINTVFHDDSLNAFYQMHDPMIALTTVCCFLGIAFYNFTGLMLTKELSAVHRTLIDACRSLSVWMVNLFTYYAISETYGEAWTTWSFAELGGFVLLVFGTLIYNAIIRFPCFNYEDDIKDPNTTSKVVMSEGDKTSTMLAGSPRFTFHGKGKKSKKEKRSRKM